MKKRITIKDIAQELNVTPATVSRALSNHPQISKKTKSLVLKTAEKLNFSPNKIAASLKSGKTKVIGVLIPTAEHGFFGSVVNGISQTAGEYNYDVLIYQSNESQELEVKGIKTFMSARVDGIIVSMARDTMDISHFKEVQSKNLPLVFFDRTTDKLTVSAVVIDDYKGGYKATIHLIEQGYKRIAHISGPQHISAFRNRRLGYEAALAEHGLPFDESMVITGDISFDAGKYGIETLLALPERPDAVFAVEDFTALGVINELKRLKISVPDEIGVFGFCNDVFAKYVTPSISTIDQQNFEMGRQAFKLIMELMEKEDLQNTPPLKIVLEPLIIIRESSERHQAKV